MKQLADGLYLLSGFPPNAINVYLAQDVLIDAATRQAERRIMRQIRGRKLSAHALTHAHPDHQGASHAICERLGIPLWCGAGDVRGDGDPRRDLQHPGPGLAEPLPGALLDRSSTPGCARAARGRRGRRLHRARGARALARPRRLLARVRPRADPRRRAQRDEPDERQARPAGAAGGVHARSGTQPRIDRGDSPRSSRELTCFGHGPPLRDPRCALASSSPTCPTERDGREHLRRRRRSLRADRAGARSMGPAGAARGRAGGADDARRSSAPSRASSCASGASASSSCARSRRWR